MPYSKRLQFDNLVLDLVFFSHVLRLSDCWNIFLSPLPTHTISISFCGLFFFSFFPIMFMFFVYFKIISQLLKKNTRNFKEFKCSSQKKKKKPPKEQDGEMMKERTN